MEEKLYNDALKRYEVIEFLGKRQINFINLMVINSDLKTHFEGTTMDEKLAIYKEGMRHTLKILQSFLNKEDCLREINECKQMLNNKEAYNA